MSAVAKREAKEKVFRLNFRGGSADMSAERLLWQQVIFQALIEATWDGVETTPSGKMNPAVNHKREAHRWIVNGDEDFQEVCDLAGIDAEFLRGAYRRGRIDPRVLRKATEK